MAATVRFFNFATDLKKRIFEHGRTIVFFRNRASRITEKVCTKQAASKPTANGSHYHLLPCKAVTNGKQGKFPKTITIATHLHQIRS
jgi:hypothetical protein